MTPHEELLHDIKDLQERVAALEEAKIEDAISIEAVQEKNTEAFRALGAFRRTLLDHGLNPDPDGATELCPGAPAKGTT